MNTQVAAYLVVTIDPECPENPFCYVCRTEDGIGYIGPRAKAREYADIEAAFDDRDSWGNAADGHWVVVAVNAQGEEIPYGHAIHKPSKEAS